MCHVLFKLTSKLSKTVLEKRVLTNLLQCVDDRKFYKMDLKSNLIHFEGKEDRFHGITVDSKEENCNIEDFPKILDDSLKYWIENKKRGIWFKVGLEYTDWVPILAKKGFDFHHANPGYVMMYHWLPKETCNIPSFAHTLLAVGAIVVNEKNQILVVREKYFMSPHWKFPGGIVEPGEDLVKAAIREVKEETNIDSQFHSLIGIRHAHKGMFDCSDMYIVFSLNALSASIQKCPREILDCKWMDIQEFLNSNEVTELNKHCAQRYLDYKKKNIKIDCTEGFHQIWKKKYFVYSITDDDVKENVEQ